MRERVFLDQSVERLGKRSPSAREREDDGEEMFGDVDDVEERGRPLERLGESGKDAGVLLEVEE